jgi:hypothetical protein
MRRSSTALAVVAFVFAAAACGGRSDLPWLDGDGTSTSGGPDASALAPSPDGVSTTFVDAGTTGTPSSATPDAGPAPPCHFVPNGGAVTTLSFTQPAWSFHQEGLLLRQGAPGAAPHVVQYGLVDGAGNDGWNDPALYAAEYDVSTWPPAPVHGPTAISLADEGTSSLLELPGDRLLFAWHLQVDNEGLGPTDVLYQLLDGTTWAPGAGGTLVKHADRFAAARPAGGRGGFLATYVYEDTGDAGDVVALPPLVGLDGELAAFRDDGTTLGAPTPLWTATAPQLAAGWSTSLQGLGFSRSAALTAVAFPDCDPGVTSPWCEARSIVVLRSAGGAGGGPPSLLKAASIPFHNQDDVVLSPMVIGDGAGHEWLTWWEAPPSDAGYYVAQSLYAMPLTDEGVPAGPVESWFASDSTDALIAAWDRAPSVGPLGVVYAVTTDATTDAAGSVREVHLLHRQLDVQAPLEDVTFTTPYSAYSVVAVQVAQPRALVVGYSTYPVTSGVNGYGVLAMYTCAEDGQ